MPSAVSELEVPTAGKSAIGTERLADTCRPRVLGTHDGLDTSYSASEAPYLMRRLPSKALLIRLADCHLLMIVSGLGDCATSVDIPRLWARIARSAAFRNFSHRLHLVPEAQTDLQSPGYLLYGIF
ncbi:unnamed protein product [Heligmosomoides polygyrus]|uniref:Uncharacterized protein n=1 Tax=Heligmosomoides polygyrus TaxID=6339 RepID=A0A183FEU7_HELPZ|nr:unnamed protein product [Heligmosomoides polygyrus]